MTIPRLLLPVALATLAALAIAPQIGCGGDDEGGDASSTTGAGAGPPMAGDHLLISEIVVIPESGEFIEIWNPTGATIDLSDYYLSDNSVYYRIAKGSAWEPAGSAGSDFLVQFPPGTSIGPDAVLVLTGTSGFEDRYGRCADYALTSSPVPCSQTGDNTPKMVAPENGGLGGDGGLLTSSGEMLILFTWSGVIGERVQDVDYLIWGQNLGVSSMVDKTGTSGYSPDTATAMQRAAAAPASGESLERCAIETGEVITGGNGATGHDETSEALDESFMISAAPDPGVKNACLPSM